jgi:BlaI family transcriptional regulator, penicillinase repressor
VGNTVPSVSDAELDVLKILWQHGPCTVRDVEAHLRRRRRKWAYTTILTLLSRLREKGHVAADKSGSAHVFRAVATRDRLLREGLSDLADRICDGTASPLVHALVKGSSLTPADIAELRKLLEELDDRG